MTNEKELNKAYTFGHNKGVKAYYNEQLCTVELPEAVFKYILSLVPTEETEQEPCDDAISRQAVLDKTIRKNSIWNSITNSEGKNLEEIIFELPSVTQKSGKWIPIPYKLDCETDAECSLCHEQFIDAMNYNFCPNCGCRMVEPQESEG